MRTHSLAPMIGRIAVAAALLLCALQAARSRPGPASRSASSCRSRPAAALTPSRVPSATACGNG
jgi:hypothetical protein